MNEKLNITLIAEVSIPRFILCYVSDNEFGSSGHLCLLWNGSKTDGSIMLADFMLLALHDISHVAAYLQSDQDGLHHAWFNLEDISMSLAYGM